MRYAFILIVGCGFFLTSCSKETKKEVTAVHEKESLPAFDATYVKVTDFPARVHQFRKMPDSNLEEEIKKYESFAVLFVEYASINANPKSYTAQEQEDNTEAYMVLRDEMFSLKPKLRKNIATINKEQEARLDAADAEMNKVLPNVYQEEEEEEIKK